MSFYQRVSVILSIDQRRLIGIPIVVGCAIVGGVATAIIQPPPFILPFTGAIALAIVVLLALRRALPPVSAPTAPSEPTVEHSPFRLARLLFLGGLLLISATAFRPLAGYTAADALFLLALVIAFGSALLGRASMASPPQALLSGVALFALGGALSSMRAIYPSASALVIVQAIYLIGLWIWLGLAILRRPADLRTATTVWVASVALAGGSALLQLVAGDVIPGSRIWGGRFQGITLHVNDLGGMAGIAIVPAAALALRSHDTPLRRLLAYAAVGGVAAGLLLSGSVGGMLAALTSGAVWLAISRSASRAILPTVLVIVVGFTLVNNQQDAGGYSPLERFQRATGPAGDPGSSFASRLETYDAAVEGIATNPLVGVGLDPESSRTDNGFGVHNTLLAAWYEGGFLGFLGVLIILAAIARAAWMAIRQARSQDEWHLSVALFSAYTGVLAYSISAPILLQRWAWVPALLVLVLRAQQIATRSVSEPPHVLGPVADRRAALPHAVIGQGNARAV